MASLLATELVGRRDARDAVREAVGDARAGRGRLLAIVGEPGVGKSRLAREAVAAAAEHGVRPFVGRSVAGEVLLGPLVTAFVACGRGRPFPAAPELAAFRTVLGHLVPDWSEPAADPLPPERVVPLLSEAVLRLVRTLAPRGGLLVLEDIHAADRETLVVLDHLGDALESSGLSIVVTLRPGSPATDRWLAGVAGRRVGSVVELDPLEPAEIAALVSGCLGGPPPPGLVEFVVEHSDGLPLLVEDLLAAFVSDGVLENRGRWALVRPLVVGVPRTFAETVEHRLQSLPAQAAEVLRAAAVLGRRFDWRLPAAVVGVDSAAAMEHLRAAVDLQLVAPVADDVDTFAFRHALTREVVLGGLLPPERVRLAARAADVVDQGEDGDDQLVLSAALHADAGHPVQAAERLLALARRLLARGALDAAADALTRARSSAADAATANSVDLALLEVHASSGRAHQALEIGEPLVQRAPRDAVPGIRLWLARAAGAAGERERAVRHLDAIPATSAEHLRATILRASLAVDDRDPARAESLAEAALSSARRRGDPEAACEALQVIGRAVRLRSASEAQSWFERARTEAERADLPQWTVRALHELGTIDLIDTGRTDRLVAARRAARSLGMYETVGYVELHLGILLAHRGDPTESEAALRSAAGLGKDLKLRGLRRVATAQLSYAHALAGRADDAERLIDQVVAEDSADDAHQIAAGLAAPFVHLLREDRRRAATVVDEALRATADPSWPQWGVRALLHAVDGDAAPAHELAAAVPAGDRGRLQHAYLCFALAAIRGRTGDGSGARTAFAEAQELLGWQTAHRRFCLRLLGEAAVRDGWGEPVPWLTTALHGFRDVPPVAAACRRLIRAAGGTVPRAGRGDSEVPQALLAFGVTSREVDVLKLVVAGRTNEEIAARLHLSKRTVEGHVARLLAKTGADDRAVLVRIANTVLLPA